VRAHALGTLFAVRCVWLRHNVFAGLRAAGGRSRRTCISQKVAHLGRAQLFGRSRAFMRPIAVPPDRIRLADIFPREAIHLGLENRTKRGVVRELVHHLIDTGRGTKAGEATLVKAVLAREALGTTALGNGIAFPHCRCELAERVVGTLAIDERGVDFESLDGAPVHAVFLLVVPLRAREEHYEVLGKITAIGRDKGLRLQLRGCRTVHAVHDFLSDFG
jgi:nitrogen PTS system EIIA component